MADPFEDESAGVTREKRRVKVYDLRDGDWFDRGTGFCAGRLVATDDASNEGMLFVESEDNPDQCLLQTTLRREDSYQKQQEATLIVWNEKVKDDERLEMALSFQDADGCDAIWEFISNVLQRNEHDDVLSDDGMDIVPNANLALPSPELGNLDEIERSLRGFSLTAHGRDALAKFVIRENYIDKLALLVETAEDLESIHDLQMLCNIMKMFILLNDSAIIDHLVSEPIVFGVVGALEYDPEFPGYKANHRKYLMDQSRYKEVIKIADPAITSKIHATWRLTYLKDVVLARVLDDPTFGILNSLIFFNQVDIISYLQDTPEYLIELFALIESPETSMTRKKDAVGFIQSCCSIAKSLQLSARSGLYTTFLNHGLLKIINFAILQAEAVMRVAGTEILVSIIDHNPNLVRRYILDSVKQGEPPLHHILIDLLQNESDLGVKVQVTDALKVLLDHCPLSAPMQSQAQERETDQFNKTRAAEPQVESYVSYFFENSVARLFQPLLVLEDSTQLARLTTIQVQLLIHLVEIMIFLTKSHLTRSRQYYFDHGLIQRIALLLSAPQKHLILIALKFVRACVGLRDDAYIEHFLQHGTLTPILNIIYDSMPRDNLLNSACLELFEHIRHQGIKPLVKELATTHREKLEKITYVNVFHEILHQWDIVSQGCSAVKPVENESSPAMVNGKANGTRWSGLREMDLAEQAYFDTSDEEEDTVGPALQEVHQDKILKGNALPLKSSRLVDYPDDEDEDPTNITDENANGEDRPRSPPSLSPSPILRSPPERLAEKRRRGDDDDDDDELGRLVGSSAKRRPSSNDSIDESSNPLRRKKGFVLNDDSDTGHKIAISIGKKISPASPPTSDDAGGS